MGAFNFIGLMSINWFFTLCAQLEQAFWPKADSTNLMGFIYLGVILRKAGSPESSQSQLR